jgi:hypothetical protein
MYLTEDRNLPPNVLQASRIGEKDQGAITSRSCCRTGRSRWPPLGD